jgi:hypothetical protein
LQGLCQGELIIRDVLGKELPDGISSNDLAGLTEVSFLEIRKTISVALGFFAWDEEKWRLKVGREEIIAYSFRSWQSRHLLFTE